MMAATETVLLSGGFTVPIAVLQLAWDLEARGLELREDCGQLVVSPRSKITAEDDAAIRRHRDELLALVTYCEGIQ